MSSPRYTDITGIYTVDDKHHNITRLEYNGNAKPGQLIIDTSDYTLWIGTPTGNMVPSSTAVGGPVANAIHAVTSGAANSVAGANVIGQVANAAISDIALTVAGANVSGTVSLAALATYATAANSVAGANVSGEVALAALATYATTANAVAGSNVSGTVSLASLATYATSAKSVAGANVSGEVALAALATYATTANSVAGANVSGEVALAALSTYATTANAVAGANVSGEVTFAAVANSVAGANVSGTVALAAGIDAADAGDILIGGGALDEVLKSDGAGGMVWATVSTAPAGLDTQIQFNDAGALGASADLTWDAVNTAITTPRIALTDNGPSMMLGMAVVMGPGAPDTLVIAGQSGAGDVAYLVIGTGDTNSLGRIGTGPLTYTGAFEAATVAMTVTTVSALGTMTAGTKAFVSDSELLAVGNFGTAINGGGANYVPVWSDGTQWRIG